MSIKFTIKSEKYFFVSYIDIIIRIRSNKHMIGKDELYHFIGNNIKTKRLAKDLNQEDLAKLVGLTRSSIAQIEAGRQAPSVYLLYQLCAILKTTIISLLPKNEFDLLSSERITERNEIVEILDKVKREQEYELP